MGGLSESAVIFLVVAMGMGETLHRFPRNPDSFRIQRGTFRLVLPYGGLVVYILATLRCGSITLEHPRAMKNEVRYQPVNQSIYKFVDHDEN